MALMSEAVSNIGKAFTSSNPSAESPTKKKHRQYEKLTENLKLLLQERKAFAELGLDTTDTDDQIKQLQQERAFLNGARASGAGTNLAAELDKE